MLCLHPEKPFGVSFPRSGVLANKSPFAIGDKWHQQEQGSQQKKGGTSQDENLSALCHCRAEHNILGSRNGRKLSHSPVLISH